MSKHENRFSCVCAQIFNFKCQNRGIVLTVLRMVIDKNRFTLKNLISKPNKFLDFFGMIIKVTA